MGGDLEYVKIDSASYLGYARVTKFNLSYYGRPCEINWHIYEDISACPPTTNIGM